MHSNSGTQVEAQNKDFGAVLQTDVMGEKCIRNVVISTWSNGRSGNDKLQLNETTLSL